MSCPFCCVEPLLAVELFPGEPALRAPLVPLFRGLNAPFLGLGLEFRVALEFWRDELFMVDNEWSERFGAILGDSGRFLSQMEVQTDVDELCCL